MLLRHIIPLNNDLEEIYIVKQEHDSAGSTSNSLETHSQFHSSDLFEKEGLDLTNEEQNPLFMCDKQIKKDANGSIDKAHSNADLQISEEHNLQNDYALYTANTYRTCFTTSESSVSYNLIADIPNTAVVHTNAFADDCTQPVPECGSIPKLDAVRNSAVGEVGRNDGKISDLNRLLLEVATDVSCHGTVNPRTSSKERPDTEISTNGKLRSSTVIHLPAGKSAGNETVKEIITQCFMCEVDLLSRNKLLRHLRDEHMKDLPFDCTTCVSETITNLNRLNLHHIQHISTLKRCCFYCPARFSCGQAVSRHMRRFHPVQYDMNAEKTRRFVCLYCEQKFTKKYDLEKHERRHLIEESNDAACLKHEFKCYICNDFIGQSREDLKKHLCMHSDWLPYSCGMCGDKLINSTRVLAEHLRQHAKGLAIKCVYCDQRFVSLADCQRHEEEAHVGEKQADEQQEAAVQTEIHDTKVVVVNGQKRYQCDYCDRSYTLLNALRRHNNVHTLQKTFVCNHCGKVFNKYATFMMHEKRDHDRDSPFPCEFCSKRFKDVNRLIDHTRAHSEEKTFICNVCGKCFRIRHLLIEHKLSCFGSEITQSCVCGLCSQTFANLSVALQHAKSVHDTDIPDTKCRYCDLVFRDAESLVEHEFRHTLPGIITCNVCNRIFKHQKNLMRHLKMHADQPVPYMCDLCGKTFTQKGSLTIHRRIHTGERPFLCGLCNKGFVDKKEMRRHYTSHFNPQSKLYISNVHAIANLPETGPTGKKYKTYNCKICSRQFTSSSNLAKHITTHTGEKKYLCEFCDKRFSQGGQLTVHRRIHTGERPFACEHCGDRFLDGSSFKRHKTHNLCKRPSTTDSLAPSEEDYKQERLLLPVNNQFQQDNGSSINSSLQ